MQNFKIQFTKSVSLHQTSFNERKLEQRILPQDIETEKRSNAFLVDHKWIFNNLTENVHFADQFDCIYMNAKMMHCINQILLFLSKL